MSLQKQLKIAVLISGGGTTLKNLLAIHSQGRLPAGFSIVISSNANAAGNALATENGIELLVTERKDHDSDASFSEAIFAACRRAEVELVVMGGFLKKVVIPADFENRVINIHPSLIPDFCGKGMYGMRVHRAVIEAGSSTSGCTVHFVDNEYDHGPIVAQSKVEVLADDTPESLQRRVFAAECELYPSVITAIANGSIAVVDGNNVRVAKTK